MYRERDIRERCKTRFQVSGKRGDGKEPERTRARQREGTLNNEVDPYLPRMECVIASSPVGSHAHLRNLAAGGGGGGAVEER